MVLAPEVAALIRAADAAGIPPIESLTPDEARRQLEDAARARGPGPDVGPVRDMLVPGRAGAIPVRIYHPRQISSPGTLVYFHGGGHVLGSLETHDANARHLCAESGAVVIAVDYRLAPEHPFPAAVEDAVDAVTWAAANGAEHGGDPRRLAVAGDSAGANLAAVTALIARDQGYPDLAFQLLIYPITDYRMVGESYRTYATGCGILGAGTMAWFRRHYLPDPAAFDDWRASPELAPDHRGVAPALIVLAECDVLHDEGVRYAEQLRRAGVPARLVDVPGMIHGFFGMSLPAAAETRQFAGRALADALGGPGPSPSSHA